MRTQDLAPAERVSRFVLLASAIHDVAAAVFGPRSLVVASGLRLLLAEAHRLDAVLADAEQHHDLRHAVGAALSRVACVEQPANIAAVATAMPSCTSLMVLISRPSQVGKDPLSRKLYLRKCVCGCAYHGGREKSPAAPPHARGARAVPHHR